MLGVIHACTCSLRQGLVSNGSVPRACRSLIAKSPNSVFPHSARLRSTLVDSSSCVDDAPETRTAIAKTLSETTSAAWAKPHVPEDECMSPYCLDLNGLVETLRRELPAQSVRGDPLNQSMVDRVSEMLGRVRLNPREWKQHAVFRRGRYTRNIVGYSPGQFVALLLCWEKGQQSPIHDHSGAHCFVKLLQGTLKEEIFAWTEDGCANVDVQSESQFYEQQVAFMHDSKGLHRITNPDTEKAAVSLHIYTPPFEDCLIFPPTGACPKPSSMVSINAPGYRALQPPSGLPPPPSLEDLRETLKEVGTKLNGAAEFGLMSVRPSPEQILDLLSNIEMSAMEWATLASPAHFSEFGCVRNLIHCSEHFSVMVSCWSPGQDMPPHQIGRGRQEWIKVLNGNLCYKEHAPGMFMSEVARESLLPEGSCSTFEECATKMHSMGNNSQVESAVSLHVFSPPLTQFALHTEKGILRQDVQSLLGSVSGEPLGLGDDSLSDQASVSDMVDAADVSGACARACQLLGATGAKPATVRGLMRTAGRRYLSFRVLGKLLQEELNRTDCSNEAISMLLRKAVFNAEEWRGFLADAENARGSTGNPACVILAQHPEFSISLRFWRQHDKHTIEASMHAGRNWTLVLEGDLEERVFAANVSQNREGLNGSGLTMVPGTSSRLNVSRGRRSLLRLGTLKEDCVLFDASKDDVQLLCDSEAPCVSLHVDSPPLVSK